MTSQSFAPVSVLTTTARPAADHPGSEKALLSDLYQADRAVYYRDILATAAVAYTSFLGAFFLPFWPSFALLAVAAFAFMRGLAFIHELSHQNEKTLPGFRLAYDALFGWFLFAPDAIYGDVHLDHHRPTTHATDQDPEYLPMNGRKGEILAYLFIPLLLPIVGAIRFLLLSPLGWASPKIQRVLDERMSAVAFNPAYRRKMDDSQRKMLRRAEALVMAAWFTALSLAHLANALGAFLAMWYAVAAATIVINGVRALAAHRYRIERGPVSRAEQIRDAVDLKPTLLVRLFAPVGLHAHALHHAYPAAPYHNLAALRARLSDPARGEAPIPEECFFKALAAVWRGDAHPVESVSAPGDPAGTEI